jgi:phage replication-related protein YjqB (UPF0714/DUF867 family)
LITDKYRNFSELSRHEIEGKDFKVEYRDRGSPIIILAIHGGKIERGTAEIAYRIAGQEYSYYAFLGIRSLGNKDLHITSLKFDEPRCRTAVAAAKIAVSIHGHDDTRRESVMLGGLHGGIVQALKTELMNAGYAIKSPRSELAGITAENICNRCRGSKGAQIEISRMLRERFEAHPVEAYDFANKVGAVLSRF